jgi:hypothetical protein
MNPRLKRVFAVLVLCLVGYVGFAIGRSRSKPASEHAQLEEIVSSATDAVSDTYTGSPHAGDYSVAAFILVGGELWLILQSVVGDDWLGYRAYLLPADGGFKLTIHHSTNVPGLTKMHHD